MSRSWRPDRDGPRWLALRAAVFDRDGWRCRKCGAASRLECDHVQPLHAGGAPWDPANLQTLCRGCHVQKHRRPVHPEIKAWQNHVTQRSA